MKTLIKGTLAGGIIAFVWSMISWSLLPWHFSVLHTVANEAEVAQSLKKIAEPGVYVLPNPRTPDMEKFHRKMAEGPYAYMLVKPNGVTPNLPVMMAGGLVLHLVLALMITWLLTKSTGLGYGGKVGFVVVVALVGTLYAHLANLNWWFFPLDYTMIFIADMAIGWGLAGVVMGKIVK